VTQPSPVHRLARALLLLPLLAAGCRDSLESYPCPGSPVATFAFTGTPSQASCSGGAPAAGAGSLYQANVLFTGTIAASPSGATAALCVSHPRAEPLVGTLVADQLDVALDTRGALLGVCNARCAVTVHQQVTGTLRRDPGGTPAGFTGTLVEEARMDGTIAGADCAPCATPCTATYALTGLPPGT
jgi:hypothetical protein